MDVTVAVDCMGGDHGPHVTVPAALDFLQRCADVNIVLVGLQDGINAELRKARRDLVARIAVQHASETVGMDEAPASALRGKKDSSMRVAINLVKDGTAHAFVGSVTLKASEGLARMLGTYLREEFNRNLLTRVSSLAALPVLNAFKRRFDPRNYNGATLLGLRGIVVKSHGSADRMSFRIATGRAADEARSGVLAKITDRMSAIQENAAVGNDA